MVFFVCEHCSETLKRKAADAHYRCGPKKLTCVDCSKTFHGDEYKEHVTCISEEEKYQKTLYKGGAKQKRDPQAEWTECVAKAAATATKHVDLLQRLTGYSNVPRKLKPFVNFAKNSLRVFNDKILEELFALVQAAQPPRPAAAGAGGKADEETEAAPAAAGSKRKRSEDVEEDGASSSSSKHAAASAAGGSSSSASSASVARGSGKEGSSDSPSPFDLKRFILAQLQSEAGGKTKLKRLRKKAVEAAVSASGGSLSEEDAEVSVDKRLAKLQKKGAPIR